MANGLGLQLFGYRRTKVDRRLKSLKKTLDDAQKNQEELQKALQDLSLQVKTLRAEKEEYAAALATVKRQQLDTFAETPTSFPMTVMVGPTDTIAPITGLMDALDDCPYLNVRFRLFRDGVYRVDGIATDPVSLLSWLRKRPDVQFLDNDKGTIHVMPKEVSA
ncbi:hypothetical protein [Alicyclobacillus sp. SO9]|uniref:hypothetical protein n=1 Tax=Alicyclobacillus sp. SO9 TaxID=2665646 RepID=UPI0018E7DFD0|nr:hypothetical protein [Alicyclobacillus sp. SO9]QQE79323.1 hypothetical protein GI364_02090 [Alicyclobacillus sp. SO9]